MVTSPRLFAVGLLLLLSVYYVKARSVENKSKNNGWTRDHYKIQVNISLEKEDDEYNPGIDHTVTDHPNGSRPPTTAISSSLSTTRPFDWQPEVCDRYQLDSRALPKMDKKTDFKPGPPFTEDEFKVALLSTTVLKNTNMLPCSAVFPQNESSSRGVVNPNWPNAEIPYELDSSLNGDQRQMIIKAMEEIRNKTCISFPPWNNHTNWMRIAVGARASCFATSLGITNLPPVEISLYAAANPGEAHCFFHGTIVHEILHVAGLAHEQSRRDRDDHVSILWENIKETSASQFCKRNTKDTGYPYDHASIMHYGAYAFSIDSNNLKTIDAKENAIGQRVGLSQGDVDQLNYIYCNKTYECESEWQKLDNSSKRYCFTESTAGWYVGYAYCQRFGKEVQLASLDTTSIRTDVKNYMSNNQISRAWVGASDRSGEFTWLNGNRVTNDSWDGDVPTPDKTLCVYAYRYATGAQTLRTLTCNYFYTPIYVICEKDD